MSSTHFRAELRQLFRNSDIGIPGTLEVALTRADVCVGNAVDDQLWCPAPVDLLTSKLQPLTKANSVLVSLENPTG